MFLTLELVAFVAVFLGVFGRLMFPYFRKMKNGEKVEFDYKFLATAGEAFVEGVVIVAAIFPPFLGTVDPGISSLMLFLFGFNYGWGRTDINNRLLT